MENVAATSRTKGDEGNSVTDMPTGSVEARAAPRITLLIRAAKLVAAQGEFVCVIRDVSETGISVRLFHDLPADEVFDLQMPTGETYSVRRVWVRGNEAGFEFVKAIDVAALISEAGQYPKRGLRLGLFFPVQINSLSKNCSGIVENFSQQGARIQCDELFAIDQTLRISGGDGAEEIEELRAKVRWRRDRYYGVVFDDTLTLGEFARFAAKLQTPVLLGQ